MNAKRNLKASKVEDPHDLSFTAALVLAAFILRLVVALTWAHEPVWDGHYYHFGAERIAAGLGYSEDIIVNGHSVWRPWTHYPVGYSALLAGIYYIFGSGLSVAPITNAVIGALLVLVTHRLAHRYLSEKRARIAGLLIACHPGLIVYCAVVMTEPLAALTTLLAVWVAFRNPLRGGTLLSGALLGIATLVRPSALLVAPLLGIRRSRLKAAIITALVTTALAVATTLPWTLRNCKRMDGCAFVSTNGGWNLAIGALTTTGRFRPLKAADGCKIVTGQVQQDRCWAQVGRKVIADAPLAWLSLIPKKLAQTYNHESFAIEYLRQAAPEQWPGPRRLVARALMSTFHRVLLALSVLSTLSWFLPWRREKTLVQLGLTLAAGLAIFLLFSADDPKYFYLVAVAIPLIPLLPLPGRPRQGGVGRCLLGMLFLTTFTHAVFFGDDRYHLVISPVLCILAAGALRASPRTASTKTQGRAAQIAT